MKIGVFDSGVGGRAVANAIKKAFPDADILLREDKKNLPYGNKTPEQLLELVAPILKQMVADGCQIIVVACNTVSTNIIEPLRRRIDVPLIALEPMVKPASQRTSSGTIAVCATPATLRSKRYAWLKQAYAADKTVLEPDCSDWASMIEADKVDVQNIQERIGDVLDKGADVIVLGCTHYHWIEKEIERLCVGRAVVIQPEEPVVAQLTRVIARLT